LFKDQNAFRALAEKKLGNKYKISENKSINATELLFENNTFHLPQNLFYTDTGLFLFYNPYKTASYADETKELLLSYRDVNDYLMTK
jgi:hypothetical protein